MSFGSGMSSAMISGWEGIVDDDVTDRPAFYTSFLPASVQAIFECGLGGKFLSVMDNSKHN